MASAQIAIQTSAAAVTPVRSWADIVKPRSLDMPTVHKPEVDKVGSIESKNSDMESENLDVGSSASPQVCLPPPPPGLEDCYAAHDSGILMDQVSTAIKMEAEEKDFMALGLMTPPVLRPAARGARQCFCHGEVVEMSGNYGWLAAYASIDHPDADKHDGHIYFHRRDIISGEELFEGDPVSFYLYADSKGLGAECCQREVCGVDADSSWFNNEMQPSLGLFAQSQDFNLEWCQYKKPDVGVIVPNWFGNNAQLDLGIGMDPHSGFSLHADAAEFWPSESPCLASVAPSGLAPNDDSCNVEEASNSSAQRLMKAHAWEFVPSAHLGDKGGSEADDEEGNCDLSDGSSSTEWESTSDCVSVGGRSADVAWDSDLEVVVLNVPLTTKSSESQKGTGSCCSSSTREDSNSDVNEESWADMPMGWVRLPPGLSLLS